MQIRKERDARKRNKQFSSTSDLPLAHMVRSPPPPPPLLSAPLLFTLPLNTVEKFS